eukprot:1385286-Amorphochlora_amoeboformis.AAC.1
MKAQIIAKSFENNLGAFKNSLDQGRIVSPIVLRERDVLPHDLEHHAHVLPIRSVEREVIEKVDDKFLIKIPGFSPNPNTREIAYIRHNLSRNFSPRDRVPALDLFTLACPLVVLAAQSRRDKLIGVGFGDSAERRYYEG